MGETPPAGPTPTRVRYGVLGFACSLALITYLDRICIARVGRELRADLGISMEQMGWVFNAFTLGYLLFEVPGGWMGDAWGSRRVLTRIVLWWSIFTALTGCVWPFSIDTGLSVGGMTLAINAFAALLLVRFLFGCGEAGAFPNLARVVGGWFPYRERGLAQGAIWTSARLGGAVAPIITGRLADVIGWRQAFWVLGGIGALWCYFFFQRFRNTPEERPECNEAERSLIREGPYSWKPEHASAGHTLPPWRTLLLSANLLAVCVAAAGVSFSWYFYATFQIDFLKERFESPAAEVETKPGEQPKDAAAPETKPVSQWVEIASGLPFLFGAAGALLGGKLSDVLTRRIGRRWGRSAIGVFGFTVAGLCVLTAGFTPSAWLTVSLLCLGSFVNDLAVPVIWAVSTDIGGRYAGTVSGIMNMVGGFGPLISQPLMPWLLARGFSWPATLAIITSGWFIAALAWLRIDASSPLVPEPGAAEPSQGEAANPEQPEGVQE
jgi:ACS family glucarate transporter-like MFS transporter